MTSSHPLGDLPRNEPRSLPRNFALPLPETRGLDPLVTVEKVEGDATVTLILEDEFIKDDALIPCQVTVEISGSNKAFTEGDTIELRILEDDVPLTDIGDDVLWEIEEVADSEVVSAQRFSRTYDCSFSAVEDFLGGLEVYAEA